jgi:hypothetical protein
LAIGAGQIEMLGPAAIFLDALRRKDQLVSGMICRGDLPAVEKSVHATADKRETLREGQSVDGATSSLNAADRDD